MSESKEITLTLTQEQDFQFRIRFSDAAIAELMSDEPEPLGQGSGPSPSALLLAAVANCLSASLIFALRKFQNTVEGVTVTASAQMQRNSGGRWRIPTARVVIKLPESAGAYQRLDRVLAQFEDFCVVTQSVRDGIAVEAVIEDGDGLRLKAKEAA